MQVLVWMLQVISKPKYVRGINYLWYMIALLHSYALEDRCLKQLAHLSGSSGIDNCWKHRHPHSLTRRCTGRLTGMIVTSLNIGVATTQLGYWNRWIRLRET